MIIIHEVLGKVEILEKSEHAVIAVIDNKKIISELVAMGSDKFVVKFRKKENGIPGFKITKAQYLEIKEIMEGFERKQEEIKYKEWLTQNVTFHPSYKFSTKKNYSNETISKVRKQLIDNEKINKLSGFGDYNSTETYELTNEELLVLLEQAEKEQIEVVEQKRKESVVATEKIFAEAIRTGVKQVLRIYSIDCNDKDEACDKDNIVVYALPNGREETIRSHNW